MTLTGTNTYLVGRDPAYVIDPGPADTTHLAAVMSAGEERGGIAGVLLTHSHADHSAGVAGLGAPLLWGEVGSTDETGMPRQPEPPASDFAQTTIGPLSVVPTPGHAADHVAFLYDDACFCGDLVLGEGSSIVAPGGGTLIAYLDSLRRLQELAPALLCPGHGPFITDPPAKLSEYIEHRLDRERKLVAALDAGERSREGLLDSAWDDVPAGLRPMAALAMEAHLEKLESESRLPPDLED
jgi:glyoxylase-like metal-dependent hydrolase (beta-lactamase superfamily II)